MGARLETKGRFAIQYSFQQAKYTNKNQMGYVFPSDSK
jgi:hypothetical protein